MKITVISDLHLECLGEFSIQHLGNQIADRPADVLIMAGDICPLVSTRWTKFLEPVMDSFRHILWVPGNHEYYGSQFKTIHHDHRTNLETFMAGYPDSAQIHFLSNQSFQLGDINFIGSTLWADFRKKDPLVMMECAKCVNDFHMIRYGDRLFTPHDQLGLNSVAKRWIFAEARRGTAREQMNFVITHHAPSWRSVHDRFKTGYASIFNGTFVNDLDEQIEKHQIHTWVHGHTHNSFKYFIDNTLVYANPHGYQNENVYEFVLGPQFSFERR